MTRPQSASKQHAGLHLLIAGLVGLALVVLALVAVLPVRPLSPELNQLRVMHDSLITGRSHVAQGTPERASAAPVLETHVTHILEGRKVESWLYQLERDLFSVHRLHAATLVPRNASKLPLGSRRVAFFEVENSLSSSETNAGSLQALAWELGHGESVVLLGAGSLPTLLRLAGWIDEHGVSRPESQ